MGVFLQDEQGVGGQVDIQDLLAGSRGIIQVDSLEVDFEETIKLVETDLHQRPFFLDFHFVELGSLGSKEENPAIAELLNQ